MKVLSIGNSFSQDAQRYLHKLALNNGVDIKAVNLYIGGCSLETHYKNMVSDAPEYDFELNGESTGKKVSIKQALFSDKWDYITFQQSSYLSFDFDSYTPYLIELVAFAKNICPNAKILIHQTWAYEDKSQKLIDLGIFDTSFDMYLKVIDAYDKACKLINADGIIPSGMVMQKALDLGTKKVHRDTFHASLGFGRYMLSLCWYKVLTGKDVTDDNFNDFDEPVLDTERKIAIAAVNSIIK